MPRVDSEVYARMLIGKGHGYPLWVPEPYPEYEDQGVRIGDVGVTTSDGAFDCLFNICMPADHPIHRHVDLPESFEQVELGLVDKQVQRHLPGSDIASASIRKQSFDDVSSENGSRVEFTSLSTEGGILFLPGGASREDLRDLRTFRDYGRKNAKYWYEFVNGTLGRMVENGSIYLVTGCDKASSWAVASFSNESVDKFSATKVPESSGSYNYSWETLRPTSVRIGPSHHDDEDTLQNQCVFIRGFKFTVRECPASAPKLKRRPSTISRPPLKPRGLSSFVREPGRTNADQQWSSDIDDLADPDGNSETDYIFAPVTNASQPYHPSAVINNYLLECMPEAKVALTHDDDWRALLYDDDVAFPVDTELLRRVREKYTITLDGESVYLVPKA